MVLYIEDSLDYEHKTDVYCSFIKAATRPLREISGRTAESLFGNRRPDVYNCTSRSAYSINAKQIVRVYIS